MIDRIKCQVVIDNKPPQARQYEAGTWTPTLSGQPLKITKFPTWSDTLYADGKKPLETVKWKALKEVVADINGKPGTWYISESAPITTYYYKVNFTNTGVVKEKGK